MNHVLLGNSFSCKGPSFKPYPKIINKLFGWAQTSMRHAVNSDTARCGQHWVKQNSHIYIDVLHELVLLTVDEESTSWRVSSLPYVRYYKGMVLYIPYIWISTDFSKILSTTLWYSLHPPKISQSLTSLLYLFLHLILIAHCFYYYDLYSTRFTSSTTKRRRVIIVKIFIWL